MTQMINPPTAGYVLPPATATTLGGVIVPVSGRLVIDGSGNISAPISTAGALGVVQVGSGLSITGPGVLSLTGFGAPLYAVPASNVVCGTSATTTICSIVVPSGQTFVVSANLVLTTGGAVVTAFLTDGTTNYGGMDETDTLAGVVFGMSISPIPITGPFTISLRVNNQSSVNTATVLKTSPAVAANPATWLTGVRVA